MKGTELGCQFYLLSSPLYGLMASRYRRGSAFTTALVGKDLSFLGYFLSPSCLSSCQGSIDLTTNPPNPCMDWFLVNESHNISPSQIDPMNCAHNKGMKIFLPYSLFPSPFFRAFIAVCDKVKRQPLNDSRVNCVKRGTNGTKTRGYGARNSLSFK